MRPDKFSVSAAEALQATMGIAADAQAPAMDEERIRAASQSEKQKTAGRKNYKAGKSGRKASEDRGKPWKKK